MKKLLIKFLRWALRQLMPTAVYINTNETMPIVVKKSKVIAEDQLDKLEFWKGILIYDLACNLHEHCFYEVKDGRDFFYNKGKEVILNVTILPEEFTKLYVEKKCGK